jgi:hypothetical protein
MERFFCETTQRLEYTFMNRTFACAGAIALLALPHLLNAQQDQAPPPQYQGPPPQYSQNAPNAPSRYANNHGELGVYGDLFRVKPAGGNAVNFLGLGGRVGFNVNPYVALEAEMNYDFEKNYTTISNNGSTTGVTSTTITSRTRPITGLFGPKFQLGTSGPFRAFVTGKVGFTEFSHSTTDTVSGETFDNAFDQFGGGTTHIALYPGGGIEGFFGALGLRAEAGDQMYFNNGTYNNLLITFGPTLRF